ncbi:hypothetical protein [Candidatus Nitrospira bockiana]
MSEKQLLHPPRFVQNEQGEIVEVIVSYEDYRQFLRTLAAHADWETLPPYLQDAIDHLLAEEAKAESGSSQPLRAVVGKPGNTA